MALNDTNDIYGAIEHTLHPSDDVNSIIERHQLLINDSQIDIKLDSDYNNYPAKVSEYSSDSIPFQIIANSALEVYKDGKIIPGPLGPGYGLKTDSGRYYWNLTDHIFRFSPILLTPEDIKMHHGLDEKISIQNYNQVS